VLGRLTTGAFTSSDHSSPCADSAQRRQWKSRSSRLLHRSPRRTRAADYSESRVVLSDSRPHVSVRRSAEVSVLGSIPRSGSLPKSAPPPRRFLHRVTDARQPWERGECGHELQSSLPQGQSPDAAGPQSGRQRRRRPRVRSSPSCIAGSFHASAAHKPSARIANRRCRLIWKMLHQSIRYEARSQLSATKGSTRRAPELIDFASVSGRVQSKRSEPSHVQRQSRYRSHLSITVTFSTAMRSASLHRGVWRLLCRSVQDGWPAPAHS